MSALAGKIALITGASQGIGAAVAQRYAQEGAHVILVGRDVGRLEKVDDAIQAIGGTATIVSMDLAQGDTIDQLAVSLAQKFGKLDIVVGNAAIVGSLRPLTSITNKIWDEAFAVNVTANHRLIRSLDRLVQQSDAGRWIFVTSGAAQLHTPYWGVYAATKAALETIVKTFAKEITQPHIRANLISPGMVNTDMLDTAFPGRDNSVYASPEDITDIFVELASEKCTATGETFNAQEKL